MRRFAILLTVLTAFLILIPVRVFASETPEDTMTEEGFRSIGYYELLDTLP